MENTSSSPPPPKRARVDSEPSSSRALDNASPVAEKWLADADAPHLTLAFLSPQEMCQFRATCSAAKVAVATYAGAAAPMDFEIVDSSGLEKLRMFRKCFPGATNIRITDSSNIGLGDSDLAPLRGGVRSLWLQKPMLRLEHSRCMLPLTSLKHLVGLKELQFEEIPPGITPSSLAALAPSLDTLELGDVVSDHHAWTDLSVFTHVRSLYLCGDFALTPAIIRQLPALRRLDVLHDNGFPSDDCWPELGLLEHFSSYCFFPGRISTAIFQHLKNLKVLRLTQSGDDDLETSAQVHYTARDFAHLSKLEHFDADINMLELNDDALDVLGTIGILKTLRLKGPHAVTCGGLCKLQSLQELSAFYCPLTDGSLSSESLFPNLQKLRLICSDVGDALLAATPSLQELSIARSLKTTGIFVASFKHSTKLTSLELKCFVVTDPAQLPAVIGESLPKLHTLRLNNMIVCMRGR